MCAHAHTLDLHLGRNSGSGQGKLSDDDGLKLLSLCGIFHSGSKVFWSNVIIQSPNYCWRFICQVQSPASASVCSVCVVSLQETMNRCVQGGDTREGKCTFILPLCAGLALRCQPCITLSQCPCKPISIINTPAAWKLPLLSRASALTSVTLCACEILLAGSDRECHFFLAKMWNANLIKPLELITTL